LWTWASNLIGYDDVRRCIDQRFDEVVLAPDHQGRYGQEKTDPDGDASDGDGSLALSLG
jgi:hypothetical protein